MREIVGKIKLKVYNYENTNKLLWWETASC